MKALYLLRLFCLHEDRMRFGKINQASLMLLLSPFTIFCALCVLPHTRQDASQQKQPNKFATFVFDFHCLFLSLNGHIARYAPVFTAGK